MKLARASCSRGCVSFAVFYYLFAFAICISLLVIAIISESLEHGQVTGLVSVTLGRAAMSTVAGVVWQAGNLLLALTVQIAGPGFAMCCSGSIGMTLGTALTYCISPAGSVPWLLGGVALALAAAAVTFQMHRVKNRALKKYNREMAATPSGNPDVQLAPQRKAGLRLTFVLGGGSGLFIGLFYPLNTIALARSDSLGPPISVNASMLWFGFGVFLGSQLCLPALRTLLPQQFEDEKAGLLPCLEQLSTAAARAQPQLSTATVEIEGSTPAVGHSRSSFWSKLLQEASMASAGASCLSALSGTTWSIGFFTNLRCGSSAGFAMAFGLSQTCPLIAAFWGMLVFQEFSGPWVPTKAKVLLVVDMLLYCGAVSCFVVSKMT